MTLTYAWAATGTEDHAAISKWVSLHSFGHQTNVWSGSTSLGILKDGAPIGGVVFHDYKPSAGTIQFSGASTSPDWARGATLHHMFSYMFDDLGCQMVTTGTASTNTKVERLNSGLGFRKYVIERGWGRDVDLFFWTMTREEWLENKILQRSRRWAKESKNV